VAESKSTGIYRTTSFPAGPTCDLRSKKSISQYLDWFKERNPETYLGVEGRLYPMEQTANRYLKANRSAEEVEDAKSVIDQVAGIRLLLKTGEGDPVVAAIVLGRTFERMLVRPFEPAVRAQFHRRNASRTGIQLRRVAAAEPFRKEWQELHNSNAQWLRHRIATELSVKSGVSTKTINSYCLDLAPSARKKSPRSIGQL
jgi:hypothetical protein